MAFIILYTHVLKTPICHSVSTDVTFAENVSFMKLEKCFVARSIYNLTLTLFLLNLSLNFI